MSRVYKIVALVIIAIVLVPSIFIGACVVQAKRYKRGHTQVETGQSKQNVVDALGQPSEVQGCYGPVYFEGKVTGECATKYYYHSFLESWGVLFDKDGKVIGKFYNVSG